MNMKEKPRIFTIISLCTYIVISCASPLSNLKLDMQIVLVTVSHLKPNIWMTVIIINTIEYTHVLTVRILRLIVYTIVAVQGSLNHALCFQLT